MTPWLTPKTPEEKAVARIKELVARAEAHLNEHVDEDGDSYVEYGWHVGWRAQSVICVSSIVGENHLYLKELVRNSNKSVGGVEASIEILSALAEDLRNGYLTELHELVHAEMFSDFLDMAEHLLEQGYKDPAAVLAGGVLEEHLRKLAKKNNHPTEFPDSKTGKMVPKKAEALNTELCSMAKVYSVTDQKHVTAWLAVRNQAAHGKYTEYDSTRVEHMLGFVRNFVFRFPA